MPGSSSPCRWPRARARVAIWAWAVGLTGNCRPASASVFEGTLPTGSSFSLFAGKFCYDYLKSETLAAPGSVRLNLTRLGPSPGSKSVPELGKLHFLVFDDERIHWKKLQNRWEATSCEEKIQHASNAWDVHIDPGKVNASFRVRIHQHIRPRFWYFVLVACNTQLNEPVRYTIHAENHLWGWQSEFSLDRMGLFTVYAIFTVAFGLAGIATTRAAFRQVGVQDAPRWEHPLVRLLLLSYVASLVSCTLFLVHYSLFAWNGGGSTGLRFLAAVASTVANCTLILIAILSSIGWAITNFRISNRRCFLGTTLLVGALTALCELHAESAVSKSTKIYSYQSAPAVLNLVLKIFIFFWFAFQTKISYDGEKNDRLRRFYKFLGVSISGWSLNVPITVLLALQLSPWVRYKIVTSVDITARFFGSLLLSQLLCGPLTPISADNTFHYGPTSLESPLRPIG